jgi:hypothetical protein
LLIAANEIVEAGVNFLSLADEYQALQTASIKSGFVKIRVDRPVQRAHLVHQRTRRHSRIDAST